MGFTAEGTLGDIKRKKIEEESTANPCINGFSERLESSGLIICTASFCIACFASEPK